MTHTDETQDTSEDNVDSKETHMTVSIKEAREAVLLSALVLRTARQSRVRPQVNQHVKAKSAQALKQKRITDYIL